MFLVKVTSILNTNYFQLVGLGQKKSIFILIAFLFFGNFKKSILSYENRFSFLKKIIIYLSFFWMMFYCKSRRVRIVFCKYDL